MKLLGRRRRKQVRIPPFGGDVRAPVAGPSAIQSGLARWAGLRTLLATVVVMIAAMNLVLVLRVPAVMRTELFVADGSALGCLVPSLPEE